MPTHCVGLSPFIGIDLYILNEGLTKVGYYKSNYIALGVSNDGLSLTPDEGKLILPVEIYHSAEKKLTLFVIRSTVLHGMMR